MASDKAEGTKPQRPALFREVSARPAGTTAPSPGKPHARSLMLDGITKRYGGLTAVDDVSLEVPRGEFLTLLGPSGSGKTTLLMMIAGFTEPSAGEILLEGRRITNLTPNKRNFGMVFQGYALFPHMTVAENIAFPLRVRRMSKTEMEPKVRAAIELVQLGRFADRLPRQLSGGQQQRVALARALVFTPDILLLDEPLGALDRKLRTEVQIELKLLHGRIGTTFIYVTHDQEEALSMSDRIAIIRDGRIVQLGRPEELYEKPVSRFVASFLGESNFLSGTVTLIEPSQFRYQTGGRTLLQSGPAHGFGEHASVLLSLRPEKITLSEEEPTTAMNRLPGEIVTWNYYGSTIHFNVRTEALGDIAISVPAWRNRVEPQVDRRVWLSFAPNAATVVVDD